MNQFVDTSLYARVDDFFALFAASFAEERKHDEIIKIFMDIHFIMYYNII